MGDSKFYSYKVPKKELENGLICVHDDNGIKLMTDHYEKGDATYCFIVH